MKKITVSILVLFVSLFWSFVSLAGPTGCNVTLDGYGLCKQDIEDYNGLSSAPALSNIGQARIYFDSGLGKLQCSENGGAFANCVGGGGGGGGTVTSVSVVSANGLAGTVANQTTTPAITLSTTVTGILKGNGTTIGAATSGTDYQPALSLLKGTYIDGDICTYTAAGTLLNCNTAAGGTGTVTSVTFTGDGILDSSTPSSAVTTSGTVAATPIQQAKNTVLAGPTSGANANPTFRSLVTGDIPDLSGTYYLSSNPSSYLSTVTADSPLSGSGTSGSHLVFTNPGYITGVTADSPLSGAGTSASHLQISTAGTWSGNAATATTATNATNIATTTESGNTNYYLTFVPLNSSANQALSVGPATYNPSTNTITATTFAGNATTATSATSATTATNATNTAITDDTSTNATMYPTWVTATTGNLPQKTSSTGLKWNPSTALLTATNFSGNTTGNSVATDASNQLASDAFVQSAIQVSMGTAPLSITGGTYSFDCQGSGAQIVIHTSSGVIDSISSWTNAGSGYLIGDVIIPQGGNHDSYVVITTVSGTRPTGGTILYGGTGYSNGATPNLDSGNVIPFTFLLSGVLGSDATFIMTNGTYLTQSNQWIFANNTTGAHTVTVCVAGATDACAGGGRTMVVPQGSANSKEMFLQTDGELNVDLADVPNAANLYGTIPSAVLGNSTVYIGTTAIALNRASASQALTGITSIDGYATNVATTTKSDNTTYYISFVSANSTGNQGVDVGPMTYNPSTSNLTATTFTGALSGNASTATTSTHSTNITTADDTTTNSDYYPTIQTAISGTNPLKTSSTKLIFHPSTGLFTATALTDGTGKMTGGALSGITTMSMNNQLTNTLAIGTAPFVITSTTRVANLNVATAGNADTSTTAPTTALLATGTVTGATSQAQNFTDGINVNALNGLTYPANDTGGTTLVLGDNVTVFPASAGYRTIVIGHNSYGGAGAGLTTAALYGIAVGWDALGKNTSGYDNTGIGYEALLSVTSGHDNTALGWSADLKAATDQDETVIGASAAGNGSHTVTLGATTVTATYVPSCSAHAGQASCWTTGGEVGYCTTVVGVSGGCTCSGC